MRLIDAEAVLMCILSTGKIGKLSCIDLIKKSPTLDAVPVVRCKDCTYCEKQLAHLYCGKLCAVVTQDWYCANGKVR